MLAAPSLGARSARGSRIYKECIGGGCRRSIQLVLALKVFKIKTLETLKVRLKVPNWLLTQEGHGSRDLKWKGEIL